jgi:hypothetical protein
MLATESLAGGVPQIKVMAERKYVMVYNSIDAEWQAKPASNPAWAAYDILVRPIFDDSALNDLEDEEGNVTPLFDEDTLTFAVDPTDYLREEAFPHERVKYSDFEEWAEFCDEEQITMSMYFDGTSSVTDCLQYLCDIGRAGIVNRGNVIGVVVDRSALNMDNLNNPVPLFKFDDSNVVAGTYSENYSDRSNFPTEVQVTYFDREREYSRKSVIVRNDDSIVNHNTKDITLYACDDRDVALRHAEYILNMNLIKKGYAWTGDLDSMPLDMGDLVSIYGNLATITGVTFDEEMRRQFTAVNYSHERFGYEKTQEVEYGGGSISFTMPYAISGLTFTDFFSVNGESVIDAIYLITEIADGQAGGEYISNPDTEWIPNRLYDVLLLSAKTPIGTKFTAYAKNQTLSNTVHLEPGYNYIYLSYDINDYYKIYKDIGGVDYTTLVVFRQSILPPFFDETDVVMDERNRYNFTAGTLYRVQVQGEVAVDFPMFPPE